MRPGGYGLHCPCSPVAPSHLVWEQRLSLAYQGRLYPYPWDLTRNSRIPPRPISLRAFRHGQSRFAHSAKQPSELSSVVKSIQTNPLVAEFGSEVHHGMSGALSALPSSNLNPRVTICLDNKVRSTCLVNMSLGLSDPRILSRVKSPFRMRSCIQRSAVAKCLVFPGPQRREIQIAAVASDMMRSFNGMPKLPAAYVVLQSPSMSTSIALSGLS